MEIGEKYRVRPEFTSSKDGGKLVLVGTVTWVHPKGRFAVLEFAGGVREVFYPNQLTADRLVVRKRGGRR